MAAPIGVAIDPTNNANVWVVSPSNNDIVQMIDTTNNLVFTKAGQYTTAGTPVNPNGDGSAAASPRRRGN